MKLKFSQLVNAQAALQSLSAKQMGVRGAVHIARNLRTIQSELEIYNQKRIAILERLGTISEDNTQYLFNNGNAEKFQVELAALLAVEIETPVTLIPLDDLADVKMQPQEMVVLDWMFTENTGKPE